MAKNNDTCYKFPNCEGCTDKKCSIYNCIHTDNKETLQNALKRIEELEQKLEQTEKDLTDYQFNYPKIKDLEKENTALKEELKDANEKVVHLACNQDKDLVRKLTKAKDLLLRVIDLKNMKIL